VGKIMSLLFLAPSIAALPVMFGVLASPQVRLRSAHVAGFLRCSRRPARLLPQHQSGPDCGCVQSRNVAQLGLGVRVTQDLRVVADPKDRNLRRVVRYLLPSVRASLVSAARKFARR
jgi:hypothetical protein